MFPDPDKLDSLAPQDILLAASQGHLGLDHRFLQSLLSRPEEAKAAAAEFSKRDRTNDLVDLSPELLALFRYWHTPEAVPFLVGYVREDPAEIPDEAIETLVSIGRPALDPLLALYAELEESESGEVAFVLASLRAPDERILALLTERLEFDLSDAVLLFGIYGDSAAIPALNRAKNGLAGSETELRKEIEDVIDSLGNPVSADNTGRGEPFDIWPLYPKTSELPVDLLDEDERAALLEHTSPEVRAAAAHSFFNQELAPEQRAKILERAQRDPEVTVRARAWEALINSTEHIETTEAMLAALRDSNRSVEERSGLIVGLAPEADRDEVRAAIGELYQLPEARAKALEAMWRSMHPSFRDYFPKHLTDNDLEVRRGAIWGVGYYGLKAEVGRLRELFADEELRSDALFSYALVLPADLSRGRMKGLLARIEKDAAGLSEMEEELVKAALDERLMLTGKEPVFRQQED